MLGRQTVDHRRLRRDAFQQVALYTLVFLVAMAGAIALLWRASDIFAATHGHGTPGTWTVMGRETGSKMIRWYGDFAPDGGGPVRHHVPMEGFVDPKHGKAVVRARYRSGTAYALPGSGQWLALMVVALIPLALAAFMVGLVVQVIRQWRRIRRWLTI